MWFFVFQERNTELRSPAEGLISKAEIEQLVEEQFNNEFLFNFKVKSIEKRIESPSVLEVNVSTKIELLK